MASTSFRHRGLCLSPSVSVSCLKLNRINGFERGRVPSAAVMVPSGQNSKSLSGEKARAEGWVDPGSEAFASEGCIRSSSPPKEGRAVTFLIVVNPSSEPWPYPEYLAGSRNLLYRSGDSQSAASLHKATCNSSQKRTSPAPAGAGES